MYCKFTFFFVISLSCTHHGSANFQQLTFPVPVLTHRAGLITAQLICVLEINETGSQGSRWLAGVLSGVCSC